jgi:hypothetical protein
MIINEKLFSTPQGCSRQAGEATWVGMAHGTYPSRLSVFPEIKLGDVDCEVSVCRAGRAGRALPHLETKLIFRLVGATWSLCSHGNGFFPPR